MKDLNLLISCVGAYADSGVGTGGFVLFSGNQIHTIDKYDCTGLSLYNEVCFRFIRSEKVLVGYDSTGIVYRCKLKHVEDGHDILIDNDYIVVVSTHSNSIHWFNFKGEEIKRKTLKGQGDAWHLNCLAKVGSKLYATAFGIFDHHREWNERGSDQKGILYDLDNDSVILSGLSGPHNPRMIDGKWFICNSHQKSLRIYEPDGRFVDIPLGGFTRGVTFNDEFIFVGVNANRKDPDSMSSKIAILNRSNYNIQDYIVIPYPEIYDILICPENLAKEIGKNPDFFQLDHSKDRYAHLLKQIELSHKAKLDAEKALLEYQKSVKVKRSVLRRIIDKIKA